MTELGVQGLFDKDQNGNVIYLSMPQAQYTQQMANKDKEAFSIRQQIESYQKDKSLNIQKTQHLLEEYQTDIGVKQMELQSAKANYEHYKTKVADSEIYETIEKNKTISQHNQIAECDNTINELQEKLADVESKIQQMVASRKFEDSVANEIQQLKADNERIRKMLKSTNEYSNMSDYMEQYSKPKSYSSPQKGADSIDFDPINLKKLLNRFAIKHGLKNEELDNFVASIGEVWKNREREIVNELKYKMSMQVVAMRKKVAQQS
jgi:chromosome segregation ATPase